MPTATNVIRAEPGKPAGLLLARYVRTRSATTHSTVSCCPFKVFFVTTHSFERWSYYYYFPGRHAQSPADRPTNHRVLRVPRERGRERAHSGCYGCAAGRRAYVSAYARTKPKHATHTPRVRTWQTQAHTHTNKHTAAGINNTCRVPSGANDLYIDEEVDGGPSDALTGDLLLFVNGITMRGADEEGLVDTLQRIPGDTVSE